MRIINHQKGEIKIKEVQNCVNINNDVVYAKRNNTK